MPLKNALTRYVPGNHCNKLYRFFKGNPVKLMHGLETTAAEYRRLPPQKQDHIRDLFMHLYERAPLYEILHNGELVVAHAGIKAEYIGKKPVGKVKQFVLYGDITGETAPDGRPVRRDWAAITRARHGSCTATLLSGLRGWFTIQLTLIRDACSAIG